ncbi:MAG: hypothetical protein OXM56_02455 [Gammaproteobacteria bacterium]|nr:hypothetical protein [Gammaproteobacteria bacterium]
MADNNIPDDRLPEALIDELKRRDAAPNAITSRVDRTLAAAARAHFGAPRAVWHRPGAWAAAAASAVLAVGLATSYLPDRDRGTVYADVDGSGQIDIADVLALAREGVAQAELDAFARRVVALDGGGTP